MWWIILAIWIFLLARPKNEQANKSYYCGWFSHEREFQKMREQHMREQAESTRTYRRLLEEARKAREEKIEAGVIWDETDCL